MTLWDMKPHVRLTAYNASCRASRRAGRRRTLGLGAASLAALAAACGAPDARSASTAETAPPTPASAVYEIETIATGLEYPWSVAFLPGGDLLVTERAGWLRRVSDGVLKPAPVSGVPRVHAASQGGLLDVVPHPRFAANSLIYLSYAHGDARANTTRVARARLVDERLEDLEVIFEASPAKDTDVHYGGRMAFLPDETLLITVGDGFEYREEAQKTESHLGSVVRINDDGSVPADNPFVGQDGAAPELFTIGHRNPQGIAYDPVSERIYQHEHGPKGGDEVNILRPGLNYGWPIATRGVDYSGALISPFETYDGMEEPLRVWSPSIAPAGLTVYRGDAFPQWRGDLLVAALVPGNVRRLDIERGQIVDEEILFPEVRERVRDVREAPDGSLYILIDDFNGRILRIAPPGSREARSAEAPELVAPGVAATPTIAQPSPSQAAASPIASEPAASETVVSDTAEAQPDPAATAADAALVADPDAEPASPEG